MPDEDREWRRDVVGQMADLSRSQQQTAIVLERLSNRLDALDDWRKETRDAAREAPSVRAVTAQAWGQWAAIGIALLALILSAASHLAIR